MKHFDSYAEIKALIHYFGGLTDAISTEDDVDDGDYQNIFYFFIRGASS